MKKTVIARYTISFGIFISGILFAGLLFPAYANSPVINYRSDTSIEGRWDLTISKDGKDLPSWLEVRHSGNHTLVGRFVYAFGSARPVSKVNYNQGKFSFSIPPQWEPEGGNMEFEGVFLGDSNNSDYSSHQCNIERLPLAGGFGYHFIWR